MTLTGLDCGTGNFVCSSDAGVVIQRNAFLTINKDSATKKQLKRMNIPFVEIGDDLHIVGQDAFNYANILPNSELRRPMRDGLLNPAEKDALPILKHIVGTMIGGEASQGSKVVYCIPADPIDVERQVSYHEDVLKQIIAFYGYTPKSVFEAFALGNVGLKDDNLTGIAISFGAGMANISVMYMGLSALNFSVSKSGDWIDTNVSTDCGISRAKAQQIKEKGNYSVSPFEDVTTREHNAIKSYYAALIRYILANIANEFKNAASVPTFPNPVPIVCGGGTAMVNGFIELFRDQFTQEDFPIEVSEIKLVEEPFTAVARGCFEVAKLEFEDEDEDAS